MRIYISGPIAGVDNGNREQFRLAHKRLAELGHEVVNPHDIPSKGTTWMDYMLSDLEELRWCEAVVFLSGWEYSQGCRIEKIVAETLGLRMFFTQDLSA